MAVHTFQGLSDFLSVAASCVHEESYHDLHWDLGVTGGQAMKRALEGDPDITGKSAALIDQIEPEINDKIGSLWVPSMAGSRVVVPDFLTGRPDHMRRRVKQETQGRTVNVHVDVSSSQGVSARDLVSRGCAIVALLETLQRCQVSVNLTIGMMCRSRGEPDGEAAIVIPIESRPLDLSSASFVLAHPAFARNVVYDVLQYKYGSDLTWSKFGRGFRSYELQREYLGLSGPDLYVPAADLAENAQIIKNPKQWVQERAKQCLTGLRNSKESTDG